MNKRRLRLILMYLWGTKDFPGQMYKMDNVSGQIHRMSTYRPNIVKFICYSTRYTLGQIENGTAAPEHNNPPDWDIKTTRPRQQDDERRLHWLPKNGGHGYGRRWKVSDGESIPHIKWYKRRELSARHEKRQHIFYNACTNVNTNANASTET